MSKLALIQEMIENAESSIRSAKQILSEITKDTPKKSIKDVDVSLKDLEEYEDDDGMKIIQGLFDGKNMIDKEKNEYPVPANYSSKSKLVQGDLLKLIIKPDGSLNYKQIGPIPRNTIMGTLIYDNGLYKVLANGKLYDVNMAAVTYFRGQVGDKVSLSIPKDKDSDYGAIEAIIPQNELDEEDDDINQQDKSEKEEKEKSKTTKKKDKK